MMQQRPVIAILTANVLVGVGLRSILEKAAPAADVELFGNFQEFAEADPERFIHYFVTAQLFAAHNAFFRARSHRTIVLANGQTPAGVHCIDVQTDEERFVRSLMRLQHSVRRPEHALPVQPQAAQPLTEREAEVLTLIAGGLINKQVAATSWRSSASAPPPGWWSTPWRRATSIPTGCDAPPHKLGLHRPK